MNASGSQMRPDHRTSYACHRDQVYQPGWERQRVLLEKRMEPRPTEIAILTPTTDATLRQPASMFTIHYQQRPMVIDAVVRIVIAKLRAQREGAIVLNFQRELSAPLWCHALLSTFQLRVFNTKRYSVR